MKRTIVTLTCLLVASLMTFASTKSLHQLQQEFVDLRFGMFIHYNIPTYAPEDWPDPDLPASICFQSQASGLPAMGQGSQVCPYDLWLPYHQAP